MINNIESKIDIDEEKPNINLSKNEKDLCIDEFLANKQTRCLNGDRLTFKDFKLKS